MNWFKKKSWKTDYPKIIYRQVDDRLILVIDGEIYERIMLDREQDLFNKILVTVEKLKSGLVKDADEYAKLVTSLKTAMNSRMALHAKAMEEAERRISDDTISMAKGTDSPSARKKDAIRITSVVDEFEHDGDGLVYLAGHTVPLPRDLVKVMVESLYNPEASAYSFKSLLAFWNWAVLNPNPEARHDLFGWFQGGSFTITEDGMIVAYRRVDRVKNQSSDIPEDLEIFVTRNYFLVKQMKRSPSKYGVWRDYTGDYQRIVLETNQDKVNSSGFVGALNDLRDDIAGDEAKGSNIYTDNHTRTMRIVIGEEVHMPRADCNEDRQASCSSGLHFMNINHGGYFGDTPIVILINPMNVVAFPKYDNTKGRCCRYMPVAHAAVDPETGTLMPLNPGSIEMSYGRYSKDRLEKLILGEVGFDGLLESGEISNEVGAEEFAFIREEVREAVADRLVSHDW